MDLWPTQFKLTLSKGQLYPRKRFYRNSNLKPVDIFESWQHTHLHFQILSFSHQAQKRNRLSWESNTEDKRAWVLAAKKA